MNRENRSAIGLWRGGGVGPFEESYTAIAERHSDVRCLPRPAERRAYRDFPPTPEAKVGNEYCGSEKIIAIFRFHTIAILRSCVILYRDECVKVKPEKNLPSCSDEAGGIFANREKRDQSTRDVGKNRRCAWDRCNPTGAEDITLDGDATIKDTEEETIEMTEKDAAK